MEENKIQPEQQDSTIPPVANDQAEVQDADLEDTAAGGRAQPLYYVGDPR